MLNFNSIMLGTSNAKKLASFYEKVFEKAPDSAGETKGKWFGWQIGDAYFSINEHSRVKGRAKEPQRIILDMETNEVKEEFARIKKLEGVKVIKEPYEMEGAWIATLADPEGNYFQLTTPWQT